MAMTDRMVRAARLDTSLFEEVEADTTLTNQAMTVVILSALAAGIGGTARTGITGLIVLTLVALAGWYVWAYLTFWIGTRLLPEPQTRADVGQMLRVLGFASAPGVLRVAGVVPGMSALALMIGNIWMLVAMIVGVRQGLDYTSTWRAVGVVLLGWIVYVAVLGLLYSILRI